MLPETHKIRAATIALLPTREQANALSALNGEKLETEIEDGQWFYWYEHYHQIALQPREKDLFFHFRWGLHINVETTAVFILIAAFFIPQLQHWWVLAPALFWFVLLLAEEYTNMKKARDYWATLSEQIKYLAETPPLDATLP